MNSTKSSNFNSRPPSEQFAEPLSEHRVVVVAEEAGLRLDKWLGDRPEIISREMARRLIIQGAVLLNSQPCEPSAKVKPQDVVDFQIPPPVPLEVQPESGPLEIICEDEWLVVINKPVGMTMHPGPGHQQGTLVNLLLGHCGNLSGIGGVVRPGIVHRLDKDTSGLVVVAKNDLAHQNLAAQFKAHSIRRTYLALVMGQPKKDGGRIDLPLGRHQKNRLKRSVIKNGKEAVTHWMVEKRFPPFSLLKLNLETGRTHQIRVHLAARDWPVVGDPLYGGNRFKGLSLPDYIRERLEGFRRQALHALELGFIHPHTGKPELFKVALPQDMGDLIQSLENYYQSNP